MGRMATATTTMIAEAVGINSNAFFRRLGSPPPIAPMMRELTAKPHQPKVMTTPSAVPVMRGNASPTMASVVGKTGAMETPARNTSIPATLALLVLSIRYVVMVIRMAAASVTKGAGTLIRMGEHTSELQS